MTQSVCIVIPHHSRVECLEKALDSARGYRVFVVDDSVRGLSTQWPDVEQIRTEGEQGFSVAANQGMHAAEAAGFDWVLLLNDDAQLEVETMSLLLNEASKHDDVDALGPILVGPEGLESAGFCLSPRTARLVSRKDIPLHPESRIALSGACLLLRSHLRFDEGFPHGFEDVELGVRIKRGGRRSLLVPDARCWHLGGATISRRSPEATRSALVGHLRLVGSSRPKRALVLSYALGQVLKEGPRLSRLGALWQGWRAG